MVSFLVGITYLDKILMIRPSTIACWGGRIAHTILSRIIYRANEFQWVMSECQSVFCITRLVLLEALKVKKSKEKSAIWKHEWFGSTSSASTQRRFKNLHALSSSRIKLMLTDKTNKSGRPLKTTSTMNNLSRV